MRWRIILTYHDESTAVAPACPQDHNPNWVLPCCPGPWLECNSKPIAKIVSCVLNQADVDVLDPEDLPTT